MRFDWDDEKAESNYKKHGVTFELAMLVFDDPEFVMYLDRDADGEARWHTIGRVMKTADSEKGRTVTYRRSPGDPIPDVVKANIEELLANPKRKIDTSDIPELPADAWKHAVRGRFYRPLKEAVSLRLDADVLAWLKKDGQGYQTRVNRMLRERMLKDLEGR